MLETDTLQWVERMISEDKILELDDLTHRFGLESLKFRESDGEIS